MEKCNVNAFTADERHCINKIYDFIINVVRILNPNIDLTSIKLGNIYDLVCYYYDDIFNYEE